MKNTIFSFKQNTYEIKNKIDIVSEALFLRIKNTQCKKVREKGENWIGIKEQIYWELALHNLQRTKLEFTTYVSRIRFKLKQMQKKQQSRKSV